MEDIRQANINYEQVLAQNKNMIYSIINEVVNKTNTCAFIVCEDDLFQEGCIALYDACCNYRDGEAKFSTFAYLLIKRRIQHKYYEYSRPLFHEKYSYDAVRQVDYFSCYAVNDMHDFSVKYELDNFFKTLDDVDTKIILLRFDKVPYKTISELTHLTTKQIYYRLKRAKEKYRAYLKNDS